jgi:hypothetical protein
MPHETHSVAARHPLALHFAPRSCLSARNLLALAYITPEGAAAAANARTMSARDLLRNLLALAGSPRSDSSGAETRRCLSARNLLRNLLALAYITPEGAAAAANAKVT